MLLAFFLVFDVQRPIRSRCGVEVGVGLLRVYGLPVAATKTIGVRYLIMGITLNAAGTGTGWAGFFTRMGFQRGH